jgi:type II secretion system protein H
LAIGPTKQTNHLTITRGFTLIEILVVVVIISIIIAATSFVLKDSANGQAVRSSVNILRQRLSLAQQEAILSSSALGFSVTQSGYQFYELDQTLHNANPTWIAITRQKSLIFQPWPRKIDLHLSIANIDDVLIPDDIPQTPMIILNSGGTLSPFTLSINNFVIHGGQNGSITIEK